MKNRVMFFILIMFVVGYSCKNSNQKTKNNIVLIETTYGDIKIKLYDKTIQHRDNFKKLVENNFYDGLLFHRVIENFMIQGGDPESKNAVKGEVLGKGALDYTVSAEFFPEYFHKKGAVAAARLGNYNNPEKRSSASQFYIVQGKNFSQGALDTIEIAKNEVIKNEIFRKRLLRRAEEFKKINKNKDTKALSLKMAEIRDEVDSLIKINNLTFKFTEEQREIYSNIGGYPSLDGEYTVFGEVIEGLDVLDKIAAVNTDVNDRPISDVEMKMSFVK